jgi:hypothetical protein
VGPTFSLLTKVLDSRHVVILRDWLEFVTVMPTDMCLYIREDKEIRRQLDELSAEFGVSCTSVPAQAGDDLHNDESTLLRRLADKTEGQYLMTVNLDTLAFRSGPAEEHWVEEAFRLMKEGNFPYLTGDGIKFRDDREQIPGRFLRTRRFTNNFGLIDRVFWQEALDRHPPHTKAEAGRRFHSEWAINDELCRTDRWGLRRVQSQSWRVCHVQQWDERLMVTRKLFRKGVGVTPYLNLNWEDHRHPWQRFYNYPRPPLLQLLRIRVGELRRGIW